MAYTNDQGLIDNAQDGLADVNILTGEYRTQDGRMHKMRSLKEIREHIEWLEGRQMAADGQTGGTALATFGNGGNR